MENFFSMLQILLAVLLVGLILIQAKGTGLGSTFGSELSFYGTKRGAEKILFISTIILAVLFLISSLLSVLL